MKKITLLLLMLFSISTFAQTVQTVGTENCFTVSAGTNGNYTFTSLGTAQCSDCYNWQISPSSGLEIIGSNQTHSITVHPSSLGIYNITLSWFDSQGQCHSCTQQVIVKGGGPCDCVDCDTICFSTRGDGFANPDIYGERYMRSVITNLDDVCTCVKEIEYIVKGSFGLDFPSDAASAGVIVQDLGNYSFKVTAPLAYLLNHNGTGLFRVFFRPTDWNQQIEAKIHFTNGHISPQIMIYFIHLLDGPVNSIGVYPHEILPRDNNICWIRGQGVEPWYRTASNEEIIKDTKALKVQLDKTKKEDLDIEKSLVFPNPTDDLVSIDLKTDEKTKVSIVSLQGVTLKIFNLEKSKFQFSTKELGLKKGMYIIQIEKGNIIEKKHLIVK